MADQFTTTKTFGIGKYASEEKAAQPDDQYDVQQKAENESDTDNS